MMNIKKALQYMVAHATEEEKPVYENICNELTDHLNSLANDMAHIAELEAENERLRAEIKGKYDD